MLSWLSENLIGKVTNFDTLHRLGKLMEADGCGDLKLWYMGGLHVLVAFDSKDKAKCFLNQAKPSWSIWFEDLNFWTPNDNPKDRIASLVVSGLPPQAYSSEAFSLVTSSLGVTLIPDDCNLDNMILAAGRVVILTSLSNRINVTLEVNVDGDKYMVQVSEDLIDSWKHMPNFPMSKLSEAFEVDDSSQENSDSVGPYQLDEENDYDSRFPVESEGSTPPSPTIPLSRLVEESRVEDVTSDQAELGDLDVGINVFQAQEDAGEGYIGDMNFGTNVLNAQEVADSGYIGPTTLSTQEDNNKDDGVIRSFDLNRSVSISSTFIMPRSRSRKKVLQERRSMAPGQTISQGSVTMEVQKTIDVGNLVGFEMSGFDNQLSVDQSIGLEIEFSPEEIKRAVWACEGDKAQGPDGLTFSFIKKYWEIIGPDIVGALSDFHSSISFPCGSNSSFITLIPKVKDPIYFSDFRPISLIGSFWSFLDDVLSHLNFGTKWRSWIQECLCSARVSILMNGSPTEEISMHRGVRQGDPLAPFLFIIAMEALNVAMNQARRLGVFKGVTLPNNGPPLSHLFYADDALFVGSWSLTNVTNLIRILRCFYLASGLKINLSKTSLMGVGVGSTDVSWMADRIRCNVGHLPIKFLGIPAGASMKRVVAWQPLIDKFNSKLSNWRATSLSAAGRLPLCKSVLGSLGNHYFSLYLAPSKVLKKLESLRRNFFLGGGINAKKVTWIAWNNTISSEEQGGLGIGSLKAFNMALLAKWWWKIKVDNTSLWASAINSIHGYYRRSPRDPLKKLFRSLDWPSWVCSPSSFPSL
ncbi:hypothetical protein L6452_32690 [Arctium lappa]|uniref:Uncharacterized protein n=1 Tax=Arctium lappa TaxID=4217 RepID=A0ACB8Z6E6_ARCLA|nr:hypothetical protein L6452_32690 [Arctium lappa]